MTNRQVELDKLGYSEGNNCIVIINIEWAKIWIFHVIEKFSSDDRVLIFDCPIADTPKPARFRHMSYENDGRWKALRVTFNEAVMVFGNDEYLSILSGPDFAPAVNVFGADSEKRSMRNGFRIVEDLAMDIQLAHKEEQNQEPNWKDRMMPACPHCRRQLSRPELGAHNYSKLMEFSGIAVDGKGLVIGKCPGCGREYGVLVDISKNVFPILKELS